MEFDALYDFRNPSQSGIPMQRYYAEALEHIARVEELGFDTVWLTEHLAGMAVVAPSLR